MKTVLSILFIAISVILSVDYSHSQVTEEWAKRFTSDSVRTENIRDMHVDDLGNIYVTGSQRQTNLNLDIQALTVKYNSNGDQLWIQNFIAPSANGAFGRAIHVDAAGNVYITGENAIYSGGANEMLVIKYSSGGTQLWANRFQYVGGFYCGGFDIITDATGNVYVTGEYGNGGNNIFLVKYNSGGTLTGQTFYNSDSEGGRKIALDGAGKIIIGGYANGLNSIALIALKYEQNLDFVWATKWDTLTTNVTDYDMAVDINSNVILIGTRSNNVDFSTVKINSSGAVLWSKFYNSGFYDKPRGVVTDDSGNVYVGGESGNLGFPLTYRITIVKYDPAGNEKWVRTYTEGDGYAGYDIAIDKFSNLYMTGTSYINSDFATVKYNSDGVFQWAANYNGTGNSLDAGYSIGTDAAGNAYTSGSSVGSGTGYDIVTIKYASVSIGIQNISSEIPGGYSLSQNYPNPFNPSTVINFSIPKSGHTELRIFDINGKEIEALHNGFLNAGQYRYDFSPADICSGIYFYKLETADFTDVKKMTFVK